MGKKQKNSTPQKVIDEQPDPDRISCLPGHVIDQILTYLQIRDAVRTSVLSRKWRNKWNTLPNLVFDRNCVAAIDDQLVIERKLLKIVDHVLLLHSGPINMFKFYDEHLIGESFLSDIDRWILHLTRSSIKELVLKFWIAGYYKIPWCLFSCQSLHHLKLHWCCLKPPTTFEGFKRLKSLDLNLVTVAQDAFENLISGCPLLEKLKLIEVDGFTQINIRAPNLKFLEIDGEYEGINFDNTFQLAVVVIDLWWDFNLQSSNQGGSRESSNMLKIFDHLPHIQSLVIESNFLKYLAAGVLPVKLPTPCIYLSYLSLCINFDNLKEISAALCLLRSSPNLRKLEIFSWNEARASPFTPAAYCWEDIFSAPAMPIQVRHVAIDGIFGTNLELDFIKFLLLYSPMLEKMTLKPVESFTPELVRGLIRFKRASGEAEVIWEDSSLHNDYLVIDN
ncbi:putative F-box domain, leucine-rich repeat domain, L domain-containing protein [Medicago truncatula]|uniref:Putative F-box domain, leucine-rich repeat domain, L domain-containing protein n=1 Tax=Medicago truncatula TaxID=3880 RepID=A0A396J723_MEDTR|nr:F-box/FBD/LRR-repeat protein At1g13570 [Medicago truncatula]RHN73870.1 putative F-box domain, leucine-rich repeat domain, L domain-containing protein [Medicago truncatula]